MKAWRTDKVSIWPTMEHEPDEPKLGLFAISLGKGMPERALRITKENDRFLVTMDGYPLANPSPKWRQAFGQVIRKTTMLLGRPIKEDEYDRIVARRLEDSFDGVDAEKPIDLNRARVPF